MALTRVQINRAATLRHTFYVGETATDAAAGVTVDVKRLDGTVVVSGAAATNAGTGVYTPELAAQAQLDTLTVDWSGDVSGARTDRDVVEVAGGFYFELAEARAAHRSLADTNTYPTTLLEQKRVVVEQECERIRHQALVPRYARFLLDGSGAPELVVPDMQLRAIRSASVAAQAGGTFVDLSVDELAAVAAEASGLLIRDDGNVWPAGRRNVLVEYEYGLDAPPSDIRDAAILRLRSVLSATRTAIPDRAVSFTLADGGVYRLSAPGPRSTGIPEVDAAYQADANERVWIA